MLSLQEQMVYYGIRKWTSNAALDTNQQYKSSSFFIPRLCGSQKKKNLRAAMRQYIWTNWVGISRNCAKLGMSPLIYASISYENN
jgi:hypothetical protein